jgi:hypothetical protein
MSAVKNSIRITGATAVLSSCGASYTPTHAPAAATVRALPADDAAEWFALAQALRARHRSQTSHPAGSAL